MAFEFDAAFWATVSLFVFLAVIIYLKVPGMIGKALDGRIKAIETELAEAERLRLEAKFLLEEYESKRESAAKEAEGIVAAAREDGHGADMFLQRLHDDPLAITDEIVERLDRGIAFLCKVTHRHLEQPALRDQPARAGENRRASAGGARGICVGHAVRGHPSLQLCRRIRGVA